MPGGTVILLLHLCRNLPVILMIQKISLLMRKKVIADCRYTYNCLVLSGAKWMEQRNLLDKEEAQLLNSVHNLRRRVAQHMKDSF